MENRKEKTPAVYYAPDNVSEVLTRRQAAGYLKICLNNIDLLPIPRVRIGRSVRFRKADIDTWLEQTAAKVVLS
ncbi:helix-turn-helix MerR-family like proteins [Candidatus Termititenax persephonae]|uniref:Helix-turn-helix MerR-family like proteins n=1 Tax=Candidatus Termititenax persephonae TaxID=2218525 RepID=A0A388THC6_9BACT|nr:helix-turn-helix MerR-family like proteins [Candidatus Termititenax persephonae]